MKSSGTTVLVYIYKICTAQNSHSVRHDEDYKPSNTAS